MTPWLFLFKGHIYAPFSICSLEWRKILANQFSRRPASGRPVLPVRGGLSTSLARCVPLGSCAVFDTVCSVLAGVSAVLATASYCCYGLQGAHIWSALRCRGNKLTRWHRVVTLMVSMNKPQKLCTQTPVFHSADGRRLRSTNFPHIKLWHGRQNGTTLKDISNFIPNNITLQSLLFPGNKF